jgi:molybdopterin biosynthesis enzyme
MSEQIEPLQRIDRLTPLEDVLARIDALVKPVAVRGVQPAAASGRTLARDIVVAGPMPAAALALRDGWAVPSELTADAGLYAPAPLAAAIRIDAGEPLPAGTDAVAPFDAVGLRGGQAQALSPVAPGDGVWPVGADAAPGAVLARAGNRLSPLHVALLAAIGIDSVAIREPRIGVASARPSADRIIDAALQCIASGFEHRGAVVVRSAATETLEHILIEADADAVVLVGGTGCGRADTVVATLAAKGKIVAHGIGLIPAETACFGLAGERPVLLLPGRLEGALAASHLLGGAMLARLAGASEPLRLRPATLTRKVSSTAGLAELVPVSCESRFATPIGSGYVPLAALAQANGWLFIAPGSEGFQAQSEVMIRPWP